MRLIKSKKGASTDMLITVGILLVAALLFVYTINIFYDSVETSVKGDPSVGARMIGTYLDYAYASSNPIKIYHEVPSDLLGNPGYGTILYDPETCTIKANKYPQDYMTEFILNSGFGEITIEEGLTAYALSKWRKKMLNAQGVFSTISKQGMKEAEEQISKKIRDEGIDVTTTEGKEAARKIQSKVIKAEAKKAATRYRLLGGNLGKIGRGEATQEAMAFASKKGFTGGAAQPLTNFAETSPAKATQFMDSEGSSIIARTYHNGYGMDDAIKAAKAAGKSGDDFAKYLASGDDSAKILLELAGREGGQALGDELPASAAMRGAFQSNPKLADQAMKLAASDMTDEEFSLAMKGFSRNADDIVTTAHFLDLAKDGRQSLAAVDDLGKMAAILADEPGMRKMLASSDVAQKAIMNSKARSEITETFVKPIAKDSTSDASKLVIKHASKRRMLGKPLTFSPILNAVRKRGVLGAITEGVGKRGSNFKSKLGSGALALLQGKPITNTGKFMFNNVIKKSVLGKVIWKNTGKRAAKSLTTQLPAAAANKMINCEAIGAATFGTGAVICYAGKTVMNVAMASLEYFFSYLPISHFIDRSQDATKAVNKEWGEFSCHIPQKTIKVGQPNCESGPAINKIEVVETLHNNKVISALRDTPLIGYVVDFLFSPVKALEALLQTPSSKPELDSPKEYDYIENSDADCSNSHNYLLSNDAVKVISGVTTALDSSEYMEGRAVGYSLGNPESVVGPIKAPFWGCVALAAIPKVQDWTPGCLTIWTAGYVSMWADPDLSVGQIIALETITGFLAGPAGFAAINIYLLNPIDSTNFFPYLSKSGGMIDTDKYYYIEDPYVVSISKEFDEDGNSHVVLDKEI